VVRRVSVLAKLRREAAQLASRLEKLVSRAGKLVVVVEKLGGPGRMRLVSR